MEPEIVVIVGDHDATLGTDEGEMLLVRRPLQAHIRCGGDVDAATSQPVGDRRVNMLIQSDRLQGDMMASPLPSYLEHKLVMYMPHGGLRDMAMALDSAARNWTHMPTG